MAQLKVILLFAMTVVVMAVIVSARPAESDSAEIVMKIEKINEQLPGVQAAKPKEQNELKEEAPGDDTKPKKTQRNYPVYYVNTKVNGKFGKSVRAFTSEEFVERYPMKD